MPKTKHVRRPPPDELLTLPARVEEAMRDKGWRFHSELAKASDLRPDMISTIMSGEKLPGVQAANVIRLARGLDVNPGWLLTGEGPKRSEHKESPFAPGSPEFERLVDAVAARLDRRG